MTLDEQALTELAELPHRYPVARSAIVPMLHLVQSVEGHVSANGMRAIANELGLSVAEVAAVATFYTMFKMRPVGEHHVGVCVNPQCGILGGDRIWEILAEELGVGSGGTTSDGKITLERIECQAACTNAPVMTADWEFLDNMTVAQAREIVSRLRGGEPVQSTRGAVVRSFRATARTLSGIDDDGLADAGGNDANAQMLRGLRVARDRGMESPDVAAPQKARGGGGR